jgi:hypothetical protein
LQRILDGKTTPWGITVQSVEIRDVQIPSALQDAMSREARAERERRARTILGEAETEIADQFVRGRLLISTNPVALHLRAMNMLYEAIKSGVPWSSCHLPLSKLRVSAVLSLRLHWAARNPRSKRCAARRHGSAVILRRATIEPCV